MQLENAELGSDWQALLLTPFFPWRKKKKKKSHFSWNPSPEALMGVMSVMVGDGGRGGRGRVGAQWPVHWENRSIWAVSRKQAPAIH